VLEKISVPGLGVKILIDTILDLISSSKSIMSLRSYSVLPAVLINMLTKALIPNS
jgi:hypothetical protein